ncbi:hypothetical protein [Nocardioides humi]|uniref:Uncharacterized protein n=1 Tax=Nocardioides humi TaxID=449461 RepID=A0ABN2BFZ6_9ACTN|nr:hypothetical protein [Nocardioides humi]
MGRRILLVVGLAGTLLAVALVVLVMNVTFYLAASVPPRSDLPDLPPGLSLTDEDDGCGSGSCYREFTVVGAPGESASSIHARLRSGEGCSRHSLFDWRPLCVEYRIQGKQVRGSVSLGTWLG